MRYSRFLPLVILVAIFLVALCCPVLAEENHGPTIPGATISVYWVIPFVCMLLSIAIMPLAMPHFWEYNFGKIAVFWGLAFLIPCWIVYGWDVALYEFLHIIITDYIPFIILLFALFTVSGGVRLTGSLAGTPAVNTGILAVGTLLASWMGTTGAAMLLIRPLLRANAHRRYRVHSVVFFIFLVANIGGSLTPLGDPPLFLGFLRGVTFFWTMEHLFIKTLCLSVFLLLIFFVVDWLLYNKEGRPVPSEPKQAGAKPGQNGVIAMEGQPTPQHEAGKENEKLGQDQEGQAGAKHDQGKPEEKLGLDGVINIVFLGGIVGAVLLSGVYQLGEWGTVFGVPIEGQNLLRDLCLLAMAGLSWKFTSRHCRELNGFSWAPIEEVAKLFFGIFLSMIPALAILRAGTEGALGPLVRLVSNPDGSPVNAAYFWITGTLSSFLDNAPTYLVFFQTAGGDPEHLMTDMAATLIAISAGAVFMGANTYIGNAPNFMVRSIAETQGVKMPSFFGYMAWSIGILVPCFLLMTWIFIM